MLLENPLDGCFFCKPEEWRIIFLGQYVQVIAGVGPLCPGYVMLAPRPHIHTAADLDASSLWEFLAVFEILKLALKNQYGPGYTAYEHGRIGSCRMLETSNDYSTFCHHSHRVMIPVITNCFSTIQEWFENIHQLDAPDSIKSLEGQEYVYYETQQVNESIARIGFTGHKGIQSQFMRRVLTEKLNLNRDWNWASDLNYEEMIDTVSRLRGEFIGINFIDDEENAKILPELKSNITIDGFAYVGKTTIAKKLKYYFHRPVIDTGMVFRYMAYAKLQGLPLPSPDDLGQYFLSDSNLPLRTTEVTVMASELAKDPDRRAIYNELLHQMLPTLTPCIIVGRDAWRFSTNNDKRFLIEADFETRLKRRVLLIAKNERTLLDIELLAEQIRAGDDNDRIKLPPSDIHGIIRVQNGQRMFSSTIKEILHELGA